MSNSGTRVVSCPLCGNTVDRARQDWCGQCHVPVRSETFAQLLAADEALRQCQRSYDALASTWTQWGERRKQLAAELATQRPRATTGAAASAPSVQAEPPVHTQPPEVSGAGEVGADQVVAGEEISAEAEGVETAVSQQAPSVTSDTPADVFAAPAEPSNASQAASVAPSAPSSEPVQPPTVQATQPPHVPPQPRRTSPVLTAPALLGVAGASLMIAAAVVFVAIAWTTFTPLMRGLAVLVVAAAVGALSVRLRNMHLPITSGAVGVVAMGFAGAGVLAFLRETGAIGAFDLPVALLAAAGAGILLSRRRIPWVGNTAALTTIGAAVGLTDAAAIGAEAAGAGTFVSPIWAWALTGAVTSYGLVVTHTAWPWAFARNAVRWSALGWAGIVSAVIPVWSLVAQVSALGTLAGVVPLVALLGLARWWPRAAVTTAVGIATLLALAFSVTAGATGWQHVLVMSVTVTVGIVAGLRLGPVTGPALAYGLAPAATVVTIASVGYALLTALSRTTMDDELQAFQWEPGAAALITGLGFALLRAWRRDSARSLASLMEAAGLFGSVLVASGVGVLALGAAELAPADVHHVAMSAAMTVAGALLIVASPMWTAPIPRTISAWAGIALLGVAGSHGVWGLHLAEPALGWALGAALLPLGVLTAVGSRRPWPSTVLASLLATAILTSFATGAGVPVLAALALTVASAAMAAWAAPFFPSTQRRPVLIGTLPALVWGLCCALWTVAMTLGWLTDMAEAPNAWVAASALATALALASSRRLPVQGASRWAETIGAAVALTAVPGVLAALACQTDLARSWTTSGVGIASGLGLVALLPLWRGLSARFVTRVGAVVLVFLGGVGSLLRLAEDSQALAPALTLTLAATALLVLASRFWPGAAAGPAALLMTMIAPACASRAGLGLTAAVTLMATIAVMVLTVLARMPRRWQLPGTIGAGPAMLATAVGSIVIAGFAVSISLLGEYGGVGAAGPWWALALSVLAALILDRLRRLDIGPSLAESLTRAGAASVVLVVLVATPTVVVLVTSAQDVRLLLIPVIAVALATGVAAWSARWSDTLAAAIARRGTIAWVVLLAFALEVQIGNERASWAWGLLVLLGVAAALMCGARRWPVEVIAPAVALVTLAPLAVGVAVEAAGAPIICVVGLLLVGCAWAARRLGSAPRASLLLGAAPAGVVFALGFAGSVALAGWALILHLGGPRDVSQLGADLAPRGPSWWDVGIVVLACALALAWRNLGWFRGWMPLAVVAVVASVVPPVVAAAMLSAAAIALVIWSRPLRAVYGAPALASALAVLWAVGSELALAGTFATGTVVTLLIARGWHTAAMPWAATIAPFVGAATGIFAARAADASALSAPVAMGIAMATVLVLIASSPGRLRDSLAGVAIVITLLAPLLAQSVEMAGVTLLLAAVAWWRMRAASLPWAIWASAATAWVGTALILVGADVQVIEAYTAVPALFALVIGLQRMRDHSQLRSIMALWPGLALALVPSYLAVILEPNSLLRTILLVVATVVLALVGVRLRWFAPILATAVTAVVLSVLQIVVGANLVVRLVAFAVVGSLLLAISSWFEKLKELR